MLGKTLRVFAMDKLFVDLFIVAYIYFASSWSLREDYRRLLLQPISKLIWWSGLWHNWNMFAVPTCDRRYLYAQITLSGGASIHWQAPFICNLPPMKAFVRFRLSKFIYALYSSTHLTSGFCRYLLRCHAGKWAHSDQRPIEVRLYCWWVEVTPPGEPATAKPLQQWNLYVYKVPESEQC